ncbi:MAG: M48 family metalloprotease [Gammaproteobacteria bacterium]
MLTRKYTILVWIIFLCSFSLATPSSANSLAAQLPDIGDAGSTVLTPRQEKLLGQEFMRSIRQNLRLLNDPLSVAYLQNLADRLQSKTVDNSQDITVFIVDDPTVNAFAGPGGYIGIHTGLLLASRTEGELASVLAHEIAHVTQRHLVRAFKTSSKTNLVTMGAIIAAIVLGRNNPQVGEAVIASSVAGSVQQQLTFSRSHEQEADRVGLDLLASANIDPRMMVSFFEVLQQQQRASGSTFPEFLRTHPLTLARIADTRNRAQQYAKFALADNTSFQLIQARMVTLAEKTGPNPFTQQNSSIRKDAQNYYLALAAAKLNNYSLARQHIQPLLQTGTHRVLYYVSVANIELADNQPEEARRIMVKALDLFPGNPSLTELYANILIQLKQPQLAFDALKIAIRRHPDKYYLYQSYAKAANSLGNKAEAYRALAEYHAALGNLLRAIEYLTQALSAGTLDHYDQLSAEARQKELKTEVFARKQESDSKDK